MGTSSALVLAEEEAAEKRAVVRDEAIAQLNGPDERRQGQQPRNPAPAQLLEDEERGPPRPQYRAIRLDHVDGPLAGDVEGGRHRRGRRLLIRDGLEPL